MPGTPRKLSESGFYHVILKRNDARIMFECDADYTKFLSLMYEARAQNHVKYHAWCLMSTHVHILVEDPERSLSATMHHIARGYTEHYRKKYDHVGTLYTGRYWSEPIENEAYALCAMRYIHHNPVAANICPTSKYRWSSIQEYLGEPRLCTTELMLSICGGLQQLIDFHKQSMTAKPFPTSKMRNHHSDAELAVIARSVAGTDNLADVGKLPKQQRDETISRLHQAGLTNRQIARVTGISSGVVQRAISK